MNNYCRECGEKLETGTNKCPKCSADVFENRINVEQSTKDLQEYKQKENLYVISILGLYLLGFFLPILGLAGFITLIYARVTMNESKKIKILFKIFIFFTVICLIYIIFVFQMLASACR